MARYILGLPLQQLGESVALKALLHINLACLGDDPSSNEIEKLIFELQAQSSGGASNFIPSMPAPWYGIISDGDVSI
jgi:hypothetical protein